MIVTNQLITLLSESNFGSLQPPQVVSDVINRAVVQQLIDGSPQEFKIQHINNEERLTLLGNFQKRQAQKLWQYLFQLYLEAHQHRFEWPPSQKKADSDMQKFLQLADQQVGFSSRNIIAKLLEILNN